MSEPDEVIERSTDVGHAMAHGYVETLLRLSETKGETAEFPGLVYSSWVALTYELAAMGWTPKELAADAKLYAKDQAAREAEDGIGETTGTA